MNSLKQIFIGGSGRCGTSILAHIFGVHPDVLYFAEPRLLVDRGGLNDFLGRKIDFRIFKYNLLHCFRDVIINNLKNLGYVEAADVYTPQRVEEIIEENFSGDRPVTVKAGRTIDGLFSLGFATWNKRYWAEKTPHNALMADALYAMFPDMKYYHILRDPRDVCASMMIQTWGPDSPEEFIFYYNTLMRRALEVQTRIPLENYFVLSMESLIQDPLDCTLAVVDFAGIPKSEALFERWRDLIRVGEANVGRWKSSLTVSEARAIERYCYPLYEEWRKRETYTPRAMGF